MHCRYSLFEINNTPDVNSLNYILEEFCSSILKEYQNTDNLPDDLEHLIDELNGDDNDLNIVRAVVSSYISKVTFAGNKASFLIQTPDYFNCCCYDLLDKLFEFFFAKSKAPYQIIRLAGMEAGQAYSRQWLMYWSNGQIKQESTESIANRLSDLLNQETSMN